MKEFHLSMRLRNNLIRKRREELGLSCPQLAEACGASYTAVVRLEGLKDSPIKKDGTWRKAAQSLADFFKCLPEDLFPEAVLNVQKSEVVREIRANEALALAKLAAEPLELEAAPDELFENAEARIILQEAIDRLPKREKKVLNWRFRDDLTLEQIAARLGVQRERVRQIEAGVLRSLREASRWRGSLTHRIRAARLTGNQHGSDFWLEVNAKQA